MSFTQICWQHCTFHLCWGVDPFFVQPQHGKHGMHGIHPRAFVAYWRALILDGDYLKAPPFYRGHVRRIWPQALWPSMAHCLQWLQWVPEIAEVVLLCPCKWSKKVASPEFMMCRWPTNIENIAEICCCFFSTSWPQRLFFTEEDGQSNMFILKSS